jgi:hypothetical protein
MSGALAARWRRWLNTDLGTWLYTVYYLLLMVSILAMLIAFWLNLHLATLPIAVAILLLAIPAVVARFVQRIMLPAIRFARWFVTLRGWRLLGALAALGLWLVAVALIWRVNWLGAILLIGFCLSTIGEIQRHQRKIATWPRMARARLRRAS